MRRDARVMSAMDDLANELGLYLLRVTKGAATEDLHGSLCATIQEVETTFRQGPANCDTTPRTAPTNLRATPVERALDTLPQQERDLLALHLTECLTCLEIAERTRQSREAVIFGLVRAYSRLRLQLGGDLMLPLSDGE